MTVVLPLGWPLLIAVILAGLALTVYALGLLLMDVSDAAFGALIYGAAT